MNRNSPGEPAEEPVNIEHVMREVRREILERKLPGQVRLPEAAAGNQHLCLQQRVNEPAG